MTNFSMQYIHSVLYAIARTVPYGLNISSSYFLENVNKKGFKKSLARWNSFIEAVDLEVCSLMDVDSVLHMLENLGRIAMVSCPVEVDKAPLRCAQDFDTTFVFQDAFDGFKVKGRDRELLHIARVLGRGSLNAGTLVGQVLHWFYMGALRATTSYRACINVLPDKLHLELFSRLIDTHGKLTVFARCSHRSAKEATQNYTLLQADFKSISDKLVITIA